jgi:hypothetical protein
MTVRDLIDKLARRIDGLEQRLDAFEDSKLIPEDLRDEFKTPPTPETDSTGQESAEVE